MDVRDISGLSPYKNITMYCVASFDFNETFSPTIK